VIEGGAGRGALAKALLDADPACAPALRYVCVERSATLRAAAEDLLPVEPAENVFGAVVGGDIDEDRVMPGTGPVVAVLDDLPLVPVTGIVIANELFDNLPFRLFERGVHGWLEVLVGVEGSQLGEVLIGAQDDDVVELDRLAPNAPAGGRVPIQHAAAAWLRGATEVIVRGRIVIIDYIETSSTLAGVAPGTWLRTYRAHQRGGSPLDAPGEQDITCEVAVDQLRPAPTMNRTQAEFLRAHGVDDLAAAARAEWEARAHVGDLESLKARSRANEAGALLDPAGLGAFRVLEWVI
jgi:SAM-dependent MidA family methyltransferase